MRQFGLMVGVLLLGLSAFAASVGGPALETDEQYYPGVGKYRTIQDIIAAAYAENGSPASDRDKTLALNRFMMRFVYHSTNRPLERLNNDQQDVQDSKGCFDTMKFLFSYEYAICYASSSMMCGLYEAAGYTARARGVNGHTVPEAYYGGDWHYIDHDMAGTGVQADHTTIASVDELIADSNLLLYDYSAGLNFPYFPWDAISTMTGAFNGAPGYRYNDSGCAVHPTTLNLRRGESFTRYFNYDRAPWGTTYHYAGTTNNTNGPDRNLTYVYDPPVDGTNDGHPRTPYIAGGVAYYGNGVFEWVPNLADDSILDGAVSSSNIAYGASSPKLHGSGGSGEVIISQWSPYVIAGHPSGQDYRVGATDAIVISGTAVGAGVQVSVSSNNGRTWTTRSVSGSFSEDFSSLGVGRYSYLVRLTMPDGQGFDDLTFRTVTMCNQAMMPHLKDGTTNVTYTAIEEGIVYKEPDFSAGGAGWTNDAVQIQNFTWYDYNTNPSRGNSYAAVTNTGNPAWYTVRLDAPSSIKKVGFYCGLNMRQPPYSGTTVKCQYSWDNSSWTDFYSKTLATDAEHWRHYYGTNSPVSGSGNSVYLRIHLTPSGTGMSLIQLAFYAHYDTGTAPAIDVTHCWNDSVGSGRTHTENIASGTTSTTYSVSCGNNVTNQWVKLEASGSPANQDDPIATFTATPNPVTTGDPLDFDASNSQPDGYGSHIYTITSYEWDWDGDGTYDDNTGTTATTQHTFSSAGTYNVTLRVTNSNSNTDTYIVPVQVTSGTEVTDTFQEGIGSYTGCRDTYLRGEHYSVPYGSSEEIRVYGEDYNPPGSPYEARIAIAYDLSSIPAGSTVTEAKLEIYGFNIWSSGTTNMYEITSAWTEANAAWRDRTAADDWATDGGDYNSGTVLSSLTTDGSEDDTWLEWSSTPAFVSVVQGWINNPASNNGVILISYSDIQNRFCSSEVVVDGSSPDYDATYRPKLTVTYFSGGGPGDSTPPTVNVTTAVLNGTCTDAQSPPSFVLMDGSVNLPISPAPNFTTGDLTLTSGDRTVTLEATDASSNTTTVQVTIDTQ